MNVSENSGFSSKSSILIGFSIIFTIQFWGFHHYFWKHRHISGVMWAFLLSLQELMSLGGEAFSTWQGEISAILEQVGTGPKIATPWICGLIFVEKGRVRVDLLLLESS